jgi:hypothetical protein
MEQKDSNRMPIKAHPYEHQRRAYEFVLHVFEMGPGVRKYEDPNQMRMVRKGISERKKPDS